MASDERRKARPTLASQLAGREARSVHAGAELRTQRNPSEPLRVTRFVRVLVDAARFLWFDLSATNWSLILRSLPP